MRTTTLPALSAPARAVLLGFAFAAAALCFALRPALANATPTNDDFVNATVVDSFPYSDTVDVSSSTTEPGEPQYCYYAYRSVWYRITPSQSGAITANTSGSSFYDP